jgi:hypothetical protein
MTHAAGLSERLCRHDSHATGHDPVLNPSPATLAISSARPPRKVYVCPRGVHKFGQVGGSSDFQGDRVCAAHARRLSARKHPCHRTPVDPQPARDLPLRQPVRRQRPHPRPLQRAPHLPTSSPQPDRPIEPARRTGQIRAATSGALFVARPGAVLSARASEDQRDGRTTLCRERMSRTHNWIDTAHTVKQICRLRECRCRPSGRLRGLPGAQ